MKSQTGNSVMRTRCGAALLGQDVIRASLQKFFDQYASKGRNIARRQAGAGLRRNGGRAWPGNRKEQQKGLGYEWSILLDRCFCQARRPLAVRFDLCHQGKLSAVNCRIFRNESINGDSV